MYTRAPFVLLVHAVQPDEVLLSMTSYLHARQDMIRYNVSSLRLFTLLYAQVLHTQTSVSHDCAVTGKAECVMLAPGSASACCSIQCATLEPAYDSVCMKAL